LVVGLIGIALSAGATNALAQQVEGSATTPLMSFFVRGVDTAGDSSGNYLVVGGQGVLNAMCVNAQGVPISGVIPINAAPTGYASFPRVAFAQTMNNGMGGFMVVWGETPPGNPDTLRQLFARTVSCSGAVGTPRLVSGSVWWEPGNLSIAYSSTSMRFLVAWQDFPARVIKANVLDLTGAPLGGEVQLSAGQARDPGATWNWLTDQFGVSFSGETYSAFVTVPATNVALFTRNSFNVSNAILTTMTDVNFNPFTQRYVMAWFEISAGSLAKVAEFDAAGNLLTVGVASTRLGSYDALSLALNYVSGTFLLGGVDRSADTPLGLELNVRGFPFNGENTLSVTRPSYYTRVSSSAIAKSWNVAFSGPNFGAISSLVATSFASLGGPTGSFDAPPAPPPSPTPTPTPTQSPSACPGTAPVPGWVCVSGNWLPPDHPLAIGASSPAPTPTPTPAPAPTPAPGTCPGTAPVAGWLCVSGNWLPPDHPLAVGATPTPTPTPTPAPPPTSCTTIQPGPTWRCVNGNWLPPQ
jgi:hypothetical protein